MPSDISNDNYKMLLKKLVGFSEPHYRKVSSAAYSLTFHTKFKFLLLTFNPAQSPSSTCASVLSLRQDGFVIKVLD